MQIIAIVNHKGGVGKTTTTLNLGKALSLQEKKVLIIDLDPQANLSQSVGIEEPEKSITHVLLEGIALPIMKISDNFDIIPADLGLSIAETKLITNINGYFKLKNAIHEDKNFSYDYVLIDCPPSLGILTLNAMIAAQNILLVVQPQYLSMKGLDTILNLMDEIKKNIQGDLKLLGLLITQVGRVVVNKVITENIQKQYRDKVFHSQIRQNVALMEASLAKTDIFNHNPKSIGAEDYMNLAKEIIKL
jgi:chromosome partitioning protein